MFNAKEIIALKELTKDVPATAWNLNRLMIKMREAPAPIDEDHCHILWIVNEDEFCRVEWNRRIDSIHGSVNGEWEFFSMTVREQETFYPYWYCERLTLLYGAEIGFVSTEDKEQIDIGTKTIVTDIKDGDYSYIFYIK